MKLQYLTKIALLSSAMLAAQPAVAEVVGVSMLTRGETGTMIFEPALIAIQPGDTVTFVPTEPGHNAETIKDMIPEGAEPFKGGRNERFSYTFTVPGAYGIKCQPHLSHGMIALVIVGDDPANLEEIRAIELSSKNANERFAALIDAYQTAPNL